MVQSEAGKPAPCNADKGIYSELGLKIKEKVLIDVKSLYRIDELKASGM